MATAGKGTLSSNGTSGGSWTGEGQGVARAVATVSPDPPVRHSLTSQQQHQPLKGILKPPSWHCLQQCPSSTTSGPRMPIRRTVTNTFPSAGSLATTTTTASASATHIASAAAAADTERPRRRAVSFSDSMCRWQNQGSSHSLNAMPIVRRPTDVNDVVAPATIPACSDSRSQPQQQHQQQQPPQLQPPPTPAAVSARANHVWGNRRGQSSSSSSHAPRKPKRTHEEANLSALPMRKPQRRRSNETEPLARNHSITNVFQTSVNSFLMNARLPTRSASATTPRASDNRMDLS